VILPDRATRLDPEILDVLNVVALGELLADRFRRQVVRLKMMIDRENPNRAAQLVGAALGDHVQVSGRSWIDGSLPPVMTCIS
jgi:hypothetical protein